MEVETLVARAVREHLKEAAPTDDRDLVTTHVVRVEVHPDRLVVELKPPSKGWRAIKEPRRCTATKPAGTGRS
jgi:hypothetical protein